MKMSNCKTCQAPIVWAKNRETGKTVPIDMKPPVYSLFEEEDGSVTAVNLKTAAGVNHFLTCPDANKHTRGGKQ